MTTTEMTETAERLPHAALLQELRETHTGLEARIAPLSSAQMSAPGVNGAWAMRDMLAHLTAWQRRAHVLLEAAHDGTTPAPFYIDPIDEHELDRRNAAFFAASRARPLDAVLREWRATENAVEAAVPRVSEDDLTDPARFPWLHGRSLVSVVAGETYEHTREHQPDIDAFLRAIVRANTAPDER